MIPILPMEVKFGFLKYTIPLKLPTLVDDFSSNNLSFGSQTSNNALYGESDRYQLKSYLQNSLPF
jgi:hypothetical protein